MKKAKAGKLLVELGLVETAEKNLIIYGKHTLSNRAIPEFRDGFKPVHRRILWGMYKGGFRSGGSYIKSARAVADVMGKFHPHGDASIYDSMVNMANLPVKLVDGQGNWGWVGENDRAAAYRYTECRLTKYSENFILDPNYLAVIPMVPNYDGKDEEPLYLPSLLPNILVNGSLQGISVGAVSLIPSFTPQSVIKLLIKAMGNKGVVSSKVCANTLEFSHTYGGQLVSTPEEVTSLFKTGSGRLSFVCEHKVDKAAKTVRFTGIPSRFNFSNALRRLTEMDEIADVEDQSSRRTGGINVLIKTKRGTDFDKALPKIIDKLTAIVPYVLNITDRKGEEDIDFVSTNLPELIKKWLEWRVSIELASQKYQLEKTELQLRYQQLLRKAVDHLAIIFKVLKSRATDLDKELAKSLKITVEEAKQILNLQVRRLSNLSAKEIDGEIKRLRAQIVIIKKHIKKPADKVLDDIKAAAKFFKEA